MSLKLKQETALFKQNFNEWISKYPGWYVAIRKDRIVGPFKLKTTTLMKAVKAFGQGTEYLMKRICKQPGTPEPIVETPTIQTLQEVPDINGDAP